MSKSLRLTVLAPLFFISTVASPGELPTPQRVADLRTAPHTSPFTAGPPFEIAGKTALVAGTFGRQDLWVADEDTALPRRALELCSSPVPIVSALGPAAAGGLLAFPGSAGEPIGKYFRASCSYEAFRTWWTEGEIADIRPAGGTVVAALDTPGRYLVRRGNWLVNSDLTTVGTQRLQEFASSSHTGQPAVFREKRIFVVSSDPRFSVSELWTSDGTPTGTELLKSFPPGTSVFGRPTVVGNYVLLLVETSSPELTELWRTDGTVEGTALLAQLPPHVEEPPILVASASLAYFAIKSEGTEPGRTIFTLWTTNGTSPGTQPLLTEPGQTNSSADPVATTVMLGDRLYFTQGNSGNVWTTDGTPAGTRSMGFSANQLVRSPFGALARVRSNSGFPPGRSVWALSPDGSDRSLTPYSEYFELPSALAGSGVFFLNTDENDPKENFTTLWKTDGTPEGTRELRQLSLGAHVVPLGLTSDGSVLLLEGRDVVRIDPRTGARQAWFETRSLPSDTSSAPHSALAAAGKVFFTASDDQGETRWSLDSPEAQPVRLTPGPPGTLPTSDGFLYWGFTENQGPRFQWHWTDGTTTIGLPATSVSSDSPRPLLTAVGNDYWYVGNHGLFRYRGDSRSVEPLVELPNVFRSEGTRIVAHGGQHYFAAYSERDEYRLWSTDGTAAGTGVRAKLPGEPVQLVSDGEHLFFQLTNRQVWTSDGTTAGTRQLPFPPEVQVFPGLIPAAGRVFLTAFRPDAGEQELWTSDGSDAGTQRLVSHLFSSFRITAVGSGVIFGAQPDKAGAEPWFSDGTPSGTRRVADLWPGRGSSLPSELTRVGGRMFFRASDPEHGSELWVTDGTFEGTSRLTDLNPGVAGSKPTAFAALGDRLFFGAEAGPEGAEPWLLPLDAVGVRPIPPLPGETWLESSAVPGFRFQVRFAGGVTGRKEADCIGETLCVSGAVAGRPEVFLRVVGPRPNGFLWPTLVKFTTSEVEIWVEQEETGDLRYYTLAPARPGVDELPARFDRLGFRPVARVETSAEAGEAGPPPPAGSWFESSAVPGFRIKVRIAGGAPNEPPVRQEGDCIAETLCVSGAIPGRSEVFVRVVGPRPNGFLWPIVARFTGSRVEVWIEQLASGEVQYYELAAVSPASDSLTGFFDREGFQPR